jgi:hypothetical protein
MILPHSIYSVQAVAYQNLLCVDNAGHAQTISDFSHSTSHQKHPCSTLAITCFLQTTFFSNISIALLVKNSNKNQKGKQRETHICLISRHMFSIKNQMQVIPLSRNPRD